MNMFNIIIQLVNKMKLKLLVLSFFSVFMIYDALAADAGLRYIATRGAVRCGTDLSAQTYAYKDKDGYWRGIDADLCRVLATAILGDKERIEMVDVGSNLVSKALITNKIDIMLGGSSYTATSDITSKAAPVDIIYYDEQMFLAKDSQNTTSMKDYKGQKVCVISNSDDLYNFDEYNAKYNLELAPLLFPSAKNAKEAFLLNRCTLLTGSALHLTNALKSVHLNDKGTGLLPEVISVKPTYAFVARDNNALRIATKWIFNAIKLSEDKGINSQNIDIYIGVKDTSTKNLLGVEEKLWKKIGLEPQWVRKALKEVGNYGEIYENNLGKNSDFKLERKENKLLKNGGLIIPQPFL